jgi:hypothetical protein
MKRNLRGPFAGVSELTPRIARLLAYGRLAVQIAYRRNVRATYSGPLDRVARTVLLSNLTRLLFAERRAIFGL